MLFLVSKTKIVTLDIAAKILIEESQDTADHSKFKSKAYFQMVSYYSVTQEKFCRIDRTREHPKTELYPSKAVSFNGWRRV